MTREVNYLIDEKLIVVPGKKPLDAPSLYLAVWHGGFKEICDCCALQADCDELFGQRGQNCKIYHKGKRWAEVESDVIDKIKSS